MVQRNDGEKLLEIIEDGGTEDVSIDKYVAPERWEETMSLIGEKVQVDIKADILIPDVAAYPTIRIEPDKFTIEHFLAVERMFFPDCKYYSLDSPQTKEEIEQLILMTERAINDPDSDFNTAVYSDSEYQSRLSEKQTSIKNYKELIKSAPSESELKPIVVTEEMLYDNEFELIVKALSNDNELKAHVSVNANSAEKKRYNRIDLSIYYRDPSDMSHYVMAKPRENAEKEYLLPPPVTISQEQAIQTAAEAIADLGIDDMDLNYCYKLRRGDSEAYELFFTKTYREIPSNYAQNGGEFSEYAFDYRPELIHVRVNDDGIISFRWDSPSKEVETLSEKVALMPYEDIKEIARKQFGISFFPGKRAKRIYFTKRVIVDSIKLGMMRVSLPNSTDGYMVIPVWDFYGYFAEVYPA